MKFYLLAFLFFLSSLSAQVSYQKCHPKEIQEIQKFMLGYYSQELVESGLYDDVNTARKSAEKTEWIEDRQDDDKEFYYYYYVTSEDSKSKYGHLVYWIERELAYLDVIYLDEPYRGQGLGTEILQDFERVLKEQNVDKVRLYVFDHNQTAMGLYQKMGFEIEESFYNDDQLIGHHMIKNLASSS